MPRFPDLDDEFVCPYRHGCPYLEGLSTRWVWHRYQTVAGTECQYEYQLEELSKELAQERRERQQVELENQQLQAQLQALHRRQFKGRRRPAPPPSDRPAPAPRQRGAPVGHPPWQRAKPTRIDRVVLVPAPGSCPDCQHPNLQPLAAVHEHLQEDIVLEPRTVVTCFRHHQAHWGAFHFFGLPTLRLGLQTLVGGLRVETAATNARCDEGFPGPRGLHRLPATRTGPSA